MNKYMISLAVLICGIAMIQNVFAFREQDALEEQSIFSENRPVVMEPRGGSPMTWQPCMYMRHQDETPYTEEEIHQCEQDRAIAQIEWERSHRNLSKPMTEIIKEFSASRGPRLR